MREALITNAAISYDVIGGASKAIDDIAEALSSQFDRVYILVPNRSGSIKPSIQHISPKVMIIRHRYSNTFRILNPIFAYAAYTKFFRFKTFELIWGNSPEPWIYIPKNAKKKIYTVHGPWKTEASLDKTKVNKLRNLLIDLFYTFILKPDILFHFQSNYVFSACLEENSKFNNIRKVISPVLLNEQKLINKGTNPSINDSKRINILVARRLVNRTGVSEFIALTDGLESSINVTIIGDGYLKDHIKDLSSRRSNIKFLGKVTDDVLYDEIKKCDLVCMPSLDAEGFGASILQALFLLRPVLYTNIGGMKEFLDKNPDCFSFDLYHKASFASLVNKLIKLKKDANLKVNLENVSYSFVENLNEILNA